MRGVVARLTAVGALVVLTSCAGATPSAEPATPGSSEAAPTMATDASLPEPVIALTFAGAPTTLSGDIVLSASGLYDQSPNAISFDGLTGYLVSEGSGPVKVTKSFSVSAWASLAHEADAGAIVSQVGEEAGGFSLGIGESTWNFWMKDADTNEPGHTFRAKADPALVNLDRWVHLVGVFDEESGEELLYVDGQLAAETPFDAPWQPKGALTIGRSQYRGAPGDFWPGAVASVTIYQAALSAEQVAYLDATTGPSGAPPPLLRPDLHGNALLDGTWDAVLDEADAEWVLEEFSDFLPQAGQEVTVRIGIDGYDWWLGFLFDGELYLNNGDTEGDGGVLDFVDDRVVMVGADGRVRATYAWALDGDALTLTLVEQCDVSSLGRDVYDRPIPKWTPTSSASPSIRTREAARTRRTRIVTAMQPALPSAMARTGPTHEGEPVRAIAAEADKAVADLADADAQALFGFVRRLGLTDEQADDAVQEVLARLLAEYRRGIAIVNPRAWAYRTVYRLAMDEHRLRTRVRSLVNAIGRRPSRGPFDPTDRVAVWAEVDLLSLRQRQVVYLRYRSDLSFDEIGHVLGITASAARSHGTQAIATLRERLAANSGEAPDVH